MAKTSWTTTKAPVSSGSKDIVRVDWKSRTDFKCRFTGDVLPRYVYWVTTKEGKKRSIECLSFNRETEQFDPNLQDPIKEIPPEIYGGGQNEKPSFAYVAQSFDRSNGVMTLHDPLKKQAYDEIVALAQNPEYGDPSDPVKGYDVTITKVKTGPLAQNVKYKVTAGRASTPLSEEELKVEKYDLDKLFKRPTYEEQKKWLLENTTYFLGQAGAEGTLEGAKDL